MQFACGALNGFLLLALIISDLNKALYSSSLIGVICKLSNPSLCTLPEELPGLSTSGCSYVACMHSMSGGVTVNVHVLSVHRAHNMHVVLCHVCVMSRPQMERSSAGLSRATPSIHMLTLNPSCCLSVFMCLSPLLSHIAHMLDGAPVVLIIWSPCWKVDQCLGGTLAHKELCLFDWSEALCC